MAQAARKPTPRLENSVFGVHKNSVASPGKFQSDSVFALRNHSTPQIRNPWNQLRNPAAMG